MHRGNDNLLCVYPRVFALHMYNIPYFFLYKSYTCRVCVVFLFYTCFPPSTVLLLRVAQVMHPSVSADVCQEPTLQVILPRFWKWSSLPLYCHRLPLIFTSEVSSFKGLLDRCWEYARADVRTSRKPWIFLFLGGKKPQKCKPTDCT